MTITNIIILCHTSVPENVACSYTHTARDKPLKDQKKSNQRKKNSIPSISLSKRNCLRNLLSAFDYFHHTYNSRFDFFCGTEEGLQIAS